MISSARLSRFLLILALIGFLTACGPSVDSDPPPVFDYSSLDPDLADLLRSQLAAIDENPSDAVLRGELGLACDKHMLHPSALTAFEQASRLDPADPRWWYHLARSHAELGALEEALSAIERAIDLEPSYAPAHWRRGYWLLELGELDSAEAAFRQALQQDQSAAAAKIGLARVLIQGDREDAAIEILSTLLQEQPGNGYFLYLLATAYRQQGKLELVEQTLKGAQTDQPIWPDPWRDVRMKYEVGYAAELNKALRNLARRQFDQAIPQLEELRTERPDDVVLLNNLGAAYIDTGEVREGIRTLLEALKHDPDHFGCHLNLSTGYEQMGLLGKALEHTDLALEANPYLAHAHERRGIVLARLGRQQEALSALESALSYDERRPHSLFWTGLINIELQAWAAAIDSLERAAILAPENLDTQFALAHAKGSAGDIDGALAILDRVEQSRPADPRLEPMRQRVLSQR